MPELCATVDGDSDCMAVDLSVFEDPRQGQVSEEPGDAPGAVEATPGVGRLRTRVARGAVPDSWPRGERVAGELVKGQERVPCELLVREPEEAGESSGVELLLIGEDVFRAVMGRDP